MTRFDAATTVPAAREIEHVDTARRRAEFFHVASAAFPIAIPVPVPVAATTIATVTSATIAVAPGGLRR